MPPRPNWPTLAAWGLIAVVVGLIVSSDAWAPRLKPAAATRPVDAAEIKSPQLKFLARYAMALRELMTPAQRADLLSRVDASARHKVDRLRAAIVIGEFEGPAAALARLQSLRSSEDGPQFTADITDLQLLYRDGAESLRPSQSRRLVDRHGFFAELALTRDSDPSDPRRKTLLDDARRTLMAAMAASGLGLLFLAVGLALFILAIILFRNGTLRRAYQPAPNAGPYAEAFALCLAAMIGLSLVGALLFPSRSLNANWLTLLFLPAAAFYLRLRGGSWSDIFTALGWRRGHGVFREIAAGLIGHIAGLPVVVLAMLVTWLLINLTGNNPTHPVQDMPLDSGWDLLRLFLLASVLAPLVEETLFRGALFHHLRARFGWWISAGIVSLIFAAIHPQGWVAIPVLGTLAMVFAALREWRGSLIAPIAAHALNNGVMVLLMWCLFR